MKKKLEFSVVHVKSRCLLANIDNIEMCHEEFDWLFDAIAVSETWIKESVRSYTMSENYQICHTHRQNKEGEVGAIYIKNNLDFIKINILSTNIEDVMEILTVLCIKKRIVICFIYKSASENYNDFNIELESLLNISQLNKKDVFGCGDLNMDPMKHSENRGMHEFIDIMLNAGLHRYIKTNQNNIINKFIERQYIHRLYK